MIDATSSDAYEDYAFPVLHEGTRVRLRTPIAGHALRSDTGRVVRETEDDGYYVVRLDQSALYDHGVGRPEELMEVVAASDNVDIIDG
jgi:hypothetical protein